MALLQLIQNVADELGMSRPSAVVSSSDQQVRTWLRLANREGEELSRRHPWQLLRKEASFTTAATASQGALTTIASDFGRYVNESMFNRTTNEKWYGPLTPQQWQRIQASVGLVTLRKMFTIRGGLLLATPTPTASQTVKFEYISTQWCESSGGTDQSAWAADADVSLLPQRLIELGVIWRWKKSKGLEYAEDFSDYEKAVANEIMADGGSAIGSLDVPCEVPPGISPPDGGWSL